MLSFAVPIVSVKGGDAPPLPTAMTVAQLVAAALRDNAQLKALRAAGEAMREAPAQERALPNPMFTFSGMDTARRFPGTDERRYQLEQAFPWPGKRGLRARMAAQEAERMRLEYEAMRREVVMGVKESAYELGGVRQSLAIAREEERVLGQMVEVVRTKYATGEVSRQDVARAQAEVPMLRARMAELEAKEATLTARLNQLLNRSAGTPLTLVPEPPPPPAGPGLDALLEAADAHRPEVRAARAQAERSALRRAFMRREYFPDVTVGVEYRELPDADDMGMFMVGVDLPLWLSRNAAGVREAARQLEASRAEVEAARRAAEFDAREAWFGLQAARRVLDLYEKELVPRAQQRFQANEAGYRVGKVDFMNLLESERFLLNARLMRAMAEAKVGMQVARLDRAVGAEPGGATTQAGEVTP
jgi:outer membrane protein TolC